MKKEVKEALRIRFKMVVLEYAKLSGNAAKACREFEVNRSTFYKWKKAFDQEGRTGLIRKKPIARSHPRQLSCEVVEKIIDLRQTYHLGPQRITWYLERYHGVMSSCSTVYRTLVRIGLRRLPKSAPCRAIHTKRYSKTVPGHHIQVDVKFIWLKTAAGASVRRFQYTAIDDATRIRALKVFKRHTQKNAIEFVDYVIKKFPFRIHTIRSHRTDKDEFYQLLTYTGDVDLNKKLTEWENFYNFNRPHGAFHGKTPYEALSSMLKKSGELSNRI